MKKILSCLIVMLMVGGCQKEEPEVVPPSSSQVGKMCTYVVRFDNDMYNISLYYESAEGYPLKNEDDFNIIDSMSLKYSKTGKGDVSKYPISEEKVLEQCGMTNAKSVATAVNISADNVQLLINDLRSARFYFQVEKEGKLFDVKMPNAVYLQSVYQMNYNKAVSLEIDEQKYGRLQVEKTDIGEKEKPVKGEVSFSKIIRSDADFMTEMPLTSLSDVGEVYQYYLCTAAEGDLGVSYAPLMTLIEFSKAEMNQDFYVEMFGGMKITELEDVLIYENDEKVLMDINSLLYGYESLEVFVEETIAEELDGEKLNELYSALEEKVIQMFEG